MIVTVVFAAISITSPLAGTVPHVHVPDVLQLPVPLELQFAALHTAGADNAQRAIAIDEMVWIKA